MVNCRSNKTRAALRLRETYVMNVAYCEDSEHTSMPVINDNHDGYDEIIRHSWQYNYTVSKHS